MARQHVPRVQRRAPLPSMARARVHVWHSDSLVHVTNPPLRAVVLETSGVKTRFTRVRVRFLFVCLFVCIGGCPIQMVVVRFTTVVLLQAHMMHAGKLFRQYSATIVAKT
jgi:hypothetical protein